MNIHQTTTPVRRAAKNSGSVLFDELMAVMAELRTVLEAENHMLDRGFPAGLTGTAELKDKLSERFQGLYARLMQSLPMQAMENAELLRRLASEGAVLRKLAQDNMAKLDAAMEASQRRIDSVIGALRYHGAASKPYYSPSADLAAHFIPVKTAYKV